MSRMLVTVCILVLCLGFVGLHTYKILELNDDMEDLCEDVEHAFMIEDWQEIRKGLSKIEKRWDKDRFWACLTIDTEQIETIEISLKQSVEYAKIQAKEDFIGEFVMFRMNLDHLPHQEGFSIEELL